MNPLRALAGLVAGVLMMAGLVGVGVAGVSASGAVVAAPTYATFDSLSFDPEITVFDSASETLTATLVMDRPGDWAFVSAELYLYDQAGNRLPNWLTPVAESGVGQKHTITFRGQVPNSYRGYLRTYAIVYYRDTVNQLRSAGSNYYIYHQLSGATRATIEGPAEVPATKILRLTGKVTCYRTTNYAPPGGGNGWVDIQWSVPGENTWTSVGGEQFDGDTGLWTHSIASVGSTLDWRAVVYPSNNCQSQTTATLNVPATGGQLPEPPTLPGAPGLTLGAVTRTTAALDWSPAAGSGIIGYRFGWESANGLPQPAWSQVYTPAELVGNDPFVMTNLHPGTRYSMWVEAVTANGAGQRATVAVTTLRAAAPPPPAVIARPSAPRSVHGASRHGTHRVVVTWRAPRVGRVDAYQVKRTGKRAVTTTRGSARSWTYRGVRYGYVRVYVRAHSKAGWGPWASDRVRVRR